MFRFSPHCASSHELAGWWDTRRLCHTAGTHRVSLHSASSCVFVRMRTSGRFFHTGYSHISPWCAFSRGLRGFPTVLTFKGSLPTVCSCVFLKGEGTTVSFPTIFTFIRFHSTMHSHVSLKILRMPKSFPTHLAFIGFLFTVCSRMSWKGRGTAVGFPTFQTFIGFHSTMRFHVSSEAFGTTKGFPTLLTLIGFLPSVRAHAFLQAGVTAESFSTSLTVTGLLSSEHSCMSCKVGIISKGFPTYFASMSFLSTVTSHVSPKGGVVSEGFSTFLTLDGVCITEALQVSLRRSPSVPTVTGLVHTLWFHMRAQTRDTHAGLSTFFTGIRFTSIGRPWLTRAGFSTLSALVGLNSRWVSLLHRKICDRVPGVSPWMSFTPLTGSLQHVTSVLKRGPWV